MPVCPTVQSSIASFGRKSSSHSAQIVWLCAKCRPGEPGWEFQSPQPSDHIVSPIAHLAWVQITPAFAGVKGLSWGHLHLRKATVFQSRGLTQTRSSVSAWQSLTCCRPLCSSLTPVPVPVPVPGGQSPRTQVPPPPPSAFCPSSLLSLVFLFPCQSLAVGIFLSSRPQECSLGTSDSSRPLWRVTCLQLSLYQSQNLVVLFNSRMCVSTPGICNF